MISIFKKQCVNANIINLFLDLIEIFYILKNDIKIRFLLSTNSFFKFIINIVSHLRISLIIKILYIITSNNLKNILNRIIKD